MNHATLLIQCPWFTPARKVWLCQKIKVQKGLKVRSKIRYKLPELKKLFCMRQGNLGVHTKESKMVVVNGYTLIFIKIV